MMNSEEPKEDNPSTMMDIDGETNENSTKSSMNENDNDSGENSVMASGSVLISAMIVSLHPLVIMNISEHWTRIRAESGSQSKPKIIGAIIGKQVGRNVEILNSFELKFDIIEEATVIDIDFYRKKEQQFKQVFPELEFLGWYTNGDRPNEGDMKIHRQMLDFNETPLFLKLNPLTRLTGLPIKVYESIIDIVKNVPTMLFADIPYNIVTEEAERIGLDHMARMTSTTTPNGEASKSAVTEHLRVQYSALKMLRDRVKLILDFIRETKSKNLPVNHDILRNIYNLCHRLPIMNNSKFNEDFFIQINDAALMTYLGVITRCSNTMNQYVNKFNLFIDRTAVNRRARVF